MLACELRATVTGIRFLLLLAMTVGLSALLLYLALSADSVPVGEVSTSVVFFIAPILYVAAVILVSPAMSSEYEDRSFLFIASKPYGRTTYLLTKTMSLIVVQLVLLLIYFVFGAASSIYILGFVPGTVLVYYVMAALVMFALTGISILVSTVTNSSVKSIMASVVMMIIMSVLFQYYPDLTSVSCLPISVMQNITLGSGGFSPEQMTAALASNALVPALGLIAYGAIAMVLAAFIYSRMEV